MPDRDHAEGQRHQAAVEREVAQAQCQRGNAGQHLQHTRIAEQAFHLHQPQHDTGAQQVMPGAPAQPALVLDAFGRRQQAPAGAVALVRASGAGGRQPHHDAAGAAGREVQHCLQRLFWTAGLGEGGAAGRGSQQQGGEGDRQVAAGPGHVGPAGWRDPR
jgi:hypothetical protein